MVTLEIRGEEFQLHDDEWIIIEGVKYSAGLLKDWGVNGIPKWLRLRHEAEMREN